MIFPYNINKIIREKLIPKGIVLHKRALLNYNVKIGSIQTLKSFYKMSLYSAKGTDQHTVDMKIIIDSDVHCCYLGDQILVEDGLQIEVIDIKYYNDKEMNYKEVFDTIPENNTTQEINTIFYKTIGIKKSNYNEFDYDYYMNYFNSVLENYYILMDHFGKKYIFTNQMEKEIGIYVITDFTINYLFILLKKKNYYIFKKSKVLPENLNNLKLIKKEMSSILMNGGYKKDPKSNFESEVIYNESDQDINININKYNNLLKSLFIYTRCIKLYDSWGTTLNNKYFNILAEKNLTNFNKEDFLEIFLTLLILNFKGIYINKIIGCYKKTNNIRCYNINNTKYYIYNKKMPELLIYDNIVATEREQQSYIKNILFRNFTFSSLREILKIKSKKNGESEKILYMTPIII